MHGSGEVRDFYASGVIVYDGGPRTRHPIDNFTIEVSRGRRTAEALSYFTVMQAAPGKDLRVIAGGRYHDRFAKSDGLWHFTTATTATT